MMKLQTIKRKKTVPDVIVNEPSVPKETVPITLPHEHDKDSCQHNKCFDNDIGS